MNRLASKRSPSAGYTGKLFEGNPRIPVESFGREILPRGLYVGLEVGRGATVLISVGQDGGATSIRRASLTTGGIWISATGWANVTVAVEAVGAADVVVSAAWTQDPPTSGLKLRFVELLDSSGTATPVAPGSRRLAVSAVPAGFTWRTEGNGVALDLAAAFVLGAYSDVLGSEYVNAIPNVVGCWEIDPF